MSEAKVFNAATGEEVEKKESMVPLPEEDLPPDMRPSATEQPAFTGQKTPTQALEELDALVNSANKIKEQKYKEVKSEISREDKESFIRALLSNKPFTKKYSCFGGHINLTFRTLQSKEQQAVVDAVLLTSERVPYSSLQATALAHFRFMTVASLLSIERNGDDGSSTTVFKSPLVEYIEKRVTTYYVMSDGKIKTVTEALEPSPGQAMIWASELRLQDLNTPLVDAITAVSQKFQSLLEVMAREAADPDFFT